MYDVRVKKLNTYIHLREHGYNNGDILTKGYLRISNYIHIIILIKFIIMKLKIMNNKK